MIAAADRPAPLTFERRREGEALRLSARGALTSESLAPIWEHTLEELAAEPAQSLELDLAAVSYCDGAGATFLTEILRSQEARGGTASITGASADLGDLIALYAEATRAAAPARPKPKPGPISRLGASASTLGREILQMIGFIGEVTLALGRAVRDPARVRWRDTLATAEAAGVQALPLIIMLGFLIGLIMAFQAAVQLQRFGADIYVANLVGLSMLRELGPLMTAVILAGRSGSAFAAELGTMKVNEEVDALTTMGLDPVQFLIIPRLIAAVIVTPLLTIFMNICGLLGAVVVTSSLGYPPITFLNQLLQAASYGDLVGGLFKAFVFGVLVSAVGCLRGLETGSGASAVGAAATSAVVSGIVLITIFDGIFAVLYYVLGI